MAVTGSYFLRACELFIKHRTINIYKFSFPPPGHRRGQKRVLCRSTLPITGVAQNRAFVHPRPSPFRFFVSTAWNAIGAVGRHHGSTVQWHFQPDFEVPGVYRLEVVFSPKLLTRISSGHVVWCPLSIMKNSKTIRCFPVFLLAKMEVQEKYKFHSHNLQSLPHLIIQKKWF